MDVNALCSLVEVVNAGSISKGAANLFLAQATLSAQLAKLEAELGYRLFERSNRGVTLTPRGMEVYHHALQVMEQCEMISHRLFTNPNERKLKICTFGSEIIHEEFWKLCGKYDNNNYEFELYECGTQQAADRVSARNSDLAVVLYSAEQEKKLLQYLASGELALERLFGGDTRIRLGCNSPLAGKKLISVQDLQDLFFVKKSYQTNNLFSLDSEIARMGIRNSEKIILTSSSKTCYDALLSLPSFSVGASWSCKWGIGKNLVRIPFDGPPIQMYCGTITRKNEILKSELRDFLEQLTQAYG